ncbi:MAG: putative sulfate exporter family transporter, partial [Gammaproteobacteria bacterium]|nr:putative sulfate exporter family transporter [Gammaproteobacteria bacterium]
IPLLIVASVLQNRSSTQVQIPLFVILFVISAIIGSLIDFPVWFIDIVSFASKALLVLALYCIGSDITRNTLNELKGKALIHGLMLWIIVAPATLAVIVFLI